MGLPCGQVAGSSRSTVSRASTSSEITRSHAGLLVGLVPGQPDHLDQESLREPVTTHQRPGVVVSLRVNPSSARRPRPARRGSVASLLGDRGPLIPIHRRSWPARWGSPPRPSRTASRGSRRRGCARQSVVVTGPSYDTARERAETARCHPDLPMSSAEAVFLLDGHSLSYRAFFALPPTLATTTGQVTNAVYGFTSMLIKLLAEEQPDLLRWRSTTARPRSAWSMDAEYKAGRPETPDDFRQQLGLIPEVLETLKVPIVRVEGHEADDAIGTLAVRAADRGIDASIVTADRDFFQLVRPGITVMFNRKGISDIVRYDVAAVTERFGLPPDEVPGVRRPQGRPVRQHPRRPGRGGEDRGQAGPGVRLASRSCWPTPTSSRAEAEGGDRGRPRAAPAQQGARPAGDRCRARPRARGLHDGRMGPRRGPAAVQLLEFRTLLDRLEEIGVEYEARGRGGRARSARGPRRRSSTAIAGHGDTPLGVRLEGRSARACTARGVVRPAVRSRRTRR